MTILLTLLMSFGAYAGGEWDRREEAQWEQWREQSRARQLAREQAEADEIGARLAQLNGGTSVWFDASARNDGGFSGPLVGGEWRLGNGGVCVRTVYGDYIMCKGAQGYVRQEARATKTGRRRHSR